MVISNRTIEQRIEALEQIGKAWHLKAQGEKIAKTAEADRRICAYYLELADQMRTLRREIDIQTRRVDAVLATTGIDQSVDLSGIRPEGLRMKWVATYEIKTGAHAGEVVTVTVDSDPSQGGACRQAREAMIELEMIGECDGFAFVHGTTVFQL